MLSDAHANNWLKFPEMKQMLKGHKEKIEKVHLKSHAWGKMHGQDYLTLPHHIE